MWDFLCFRRMITPILIQLLYWLTTLGVIVCGIAVMAGREDAVAPVLQTAKVNLSSIGNPVVAGLLVVIFGPIVVRIYFELLMIAFRINSTLTDIRNNTKPKQASAPPARQ